MTKQKLILALYHFCHAILIAVAGFIVNDLRGAWGDSLLSEDIAILGVLFFSAIAVEALPVRWTSIQYTTLLPVVLLLALMLTEDPVMVVAISGVGTFVGYGVLRDFPARVRQVSSRGAPRILFYAAQSTVAAAIASGLYSLLPDSMPTAFIINAVMGLGWTIVYMLFSKAFAGAHNRLESLVKPYELPLPTPNLLLFILAAIAPLVTTWFYQTAPDNPRLVDLLGEQGVKSVIIFGVWPLLLLIYYFISSYLRIDVERKEAKRESELSFRYSEKMLDMDAVVGLIIAEIKAEFNFDDCIVYSWNGKKGVYEREGWSVEGQLASQTSPGSRPDIGWPEDVEPKRSILGREVERGQLVVLQGRDAQEFLENLGSSGPQSTSILILPLCYKTEVNSPSVKVGFVILTKREGKFTYAERLRAARRLGRRTALHMGLRQARLYHDAQQFLGELIEGVGVARGKVLAATQALFAQGIDPAKFVTFMGQEAGGRALVHVVRSISEGQYPEGTDEISSEVGITRLYEQIKRDDPTLPELDSEIKNNIRIVILSTSMPFTIPYRWPTFEQERVPKEMQDLYSFFLPALETNTVTEILTFDRNVNDNQEDLNRLKLAFPEVFEELSSLEQVVEKLKLSRRPGLDSESQVIHLDAALRALDSVEREKPSSYEQLILTQIRKSWADVIYNKREELLGWSEVTMQLETRTAILTAEGIVIDLRVGNRGRSAATDITVQVGASDEYDILDPDDGTLWVEKVEPGQSHQLSFKIHPKREEFVRIALRAEWKDRLRDDHNMSYADRVTLQPEAQVFISIENPFIPGPPLRPGSRLFKGREDVFDFVRNNIGTGEQHSILTLTGQRRTGKTSLALQMPAKLDRDRYVVAYVDGQALGIEPGVDLFLRDLGMMICDGLENYGIEQEPFSLDASRHSSVEGFEREFLPRILKAIDSRSLVLVFDEFEELEDRIKEEKLDITIFKFLRHLMQHTPNLAFVFVGSHRLQELTQDYWSIFFDLTLHKQIGFLEEEAARRLITESTEQEVFDPLAVDEIIRLTAGHPYFLQLICHHMVNRRNRSRLQFITVQHVRDSIPEILIQAEGHLTYLWRAATPAEKMIIAAASWVLARQDVVNISDVVDKSAAYKVHLESRDILSAETGLVAREIFERLDGDPPHYRFKVELYRRWIERNQPLSHVVELLT